MDAFEEKFGVLNPKTGKYAIEPYFLSLLNSMTYPTQVIGVILGGFLGRKFGRRMSFFVMCFWAWIAAILLVTAKHKEQMLVGRMINYIYIGQELATVPVMQSEIVSITILWRDRPGQWRLTQDRYQLISEAS
jgi:MFS transporter, SP family, sugar:H+ symporter